MDLGRVTNRFPAGNPADLLEIVIFGVPKAGRGRQPVPQSPIAAALLQQHTAKTAGLVMLLVLETLLFTGADKTRVSEENSS